MTLLSTDTYEDVQYQNDAPIGEQPVVPGGIHDIELSWDRHEGYMRIIIDGATWHFKEYLGKAYAILLKKLGPNHPNTKTAKAGLDFLNK